MSGADILARWLIPWEPSVTVCVILLGCAILYLRGCARLCVSLPRRLCFWLGMLSFYIVLQTHFDYYSEHAFFMHRIQHAVLHHLGAFLVVLARPGASLMAGLPERQQATLRAILACDAAQRLASFFNRPVIAVTLFIGLIMFWLVSPVHFIAMLDWRLYRVMNWGMAVNGLMFWGLALNNFCIVPGRLSPVRRIAMMLAIIPPQIIIGMLIFASPRELYPIYTVCGRAFSLAPLADQQIGGLILWIPAAMMSVAGLLIVMRREWMAR